MCWTGVIVAGLLVTDSEMETRTHGVYWKFVLSWEGVKKAGVSEGRGWNSQSSGLSPTLGQSGARMTLSNGLSLREGVWSFHPCISNHQMWLCWGRGVGLGEYRTRLWRGVELELSRWIFLSWLRPRSLALTIAPNIDCKFICWRDGKIMSAILYPEYRASIKLSSIIQCYTLLVKGNEIIVIQEESVPEIYCTTWGPQLITLYCMLENRWEYILHVLTTK